MFVFFCIIVASVILDQLSKWLAVIFLKGGGRVGVIPYVIGFAYAENRGAAWGMLADRRWIFILTSTLAIVGVLVYMLYKRPKDKLLVTSLSLIVGGGIGNMIDRIAYGYVVDFLEFRYNDIPFVKSLGIPGFPIFNVADSCVCVGAALLMIYLVISTFKEQKNDKKRSPASKEDSDSEGNARKGGDET